MRRKEKAILITIIANIALIILRFYLGRVSGSVGLIANAWHSFTDVFVSAVVYLGLLAERLGAKRFKKASLKIEPVLAIFVSLFIFYMSVEIFMEIISSESTELRYIPFTAAGAFLGVVVDYFMARYKIYIGEKTNSQSLIADGYHSKMDMYCSLAVLIGLFGSLINLPSLDKISAALAMILVVASGYEILSENIRLLRHPEEASKEISHAHHSHAIRESKKAKR